jgi:hypothetical protein
MSSRCCLITVALCAGLVLVAHAAAFAQGTPLFAVLVGGNVVGPGGESNAGDQNAYGSATVFFRGDDTICWAILVTNLDTPTGAAIHPGRAGVNDNPQVVLESPKNATGDSFANPGTESDCITIDDDASWAAILMSIRANPSLFYVNVRSVNFPDGGIRGQLF